MPFRILNYAVAPGQDTALVGCEPEVQFFSVRDRHFALDVNTLCLIQMDAALAARLRGIAGGDSAGVSAAGGLFYAHHKPNVPHAAMPIRSVVLMATNQCNLGCLYCYEQDTPTAVAPHMLPETAKTALQMLFARSAAMAAAQMGHRGTLHANFFGGEPLLNFPLFEEIVPWFKEWAAKRGFEAKFFVTMNGTLISADIATFLTKNDFGMIVSIDGPPPTHDEYRPFRDGSSGSHNATIAGLHMLKEAGYPMHRILLRATYTAEGVDLVERAAHLQDLIDADYAGRMSIEPVCQSENNCTRASQGSRHLAFQIDEMDGMFRHEYERLAVWFADRLKAGKATSIHHLKYMVERLLYARPYVNECAAGRSYVSVDTDGTIYPCHRHCMEPIGHIDAGGIDESKAARWLDNRLYTRKKCMACAWRHACGGGCRAQSALAGLPLGVPGEVSCWFTRTFIEEAAWIISEIGPETAAKFIPNPRQLRQQQMCALPLLQQKSAPTTMTAPIGRTA